MFFNWRGQYLFACLTFVSTFRHSVTRGSRRAIWGSATKVLLVIENASTLRHPNARRYREQTVIWSLQATLFIHHYSSHPSYTFQVVRLVGLAIERTLPSTIKTPRFFLLERAISLCLTDHRIHSAPHLAWWGAWGRPLVGGPAPPPPPLLVIHTVYYFCVLFFFVINAFHMPWTFLDFRRAKSAIVDSKSTLRITSDSMLMMVRSLSRPWVMLVRRRFLINFSFEKERSPLQLVTINTKYILNAISTLGNVSCTRFPSISLYKNISVLMSSGSSSLNMFANLANCCSSSANELSRSSG